MEISLWMEPFYNCPFVWRINIYNVNVFNSFGVLLSNFVIHTKQQHLTHTLTTKTHQFTHIFNSDLCSGLSFSHSLTLFLLHYYQVTSFLSFFLEKKNFSLKLYFFFIINIKRRRNTIHICVKFLLFTHIFLISTKTVNLNIYDYTFYTSSSSYITHLYAMGGLCVEFIFFVKTNDIANKWWWFFLTTNPTKDDTIKNLFKLTFKQKLNQQKIKIKRLSINLIYIFTKRNNNNCNPQVIMMGFLIIINIHTCPRSQTIK